MTLAERIARLPPRIPARGANRLAIAAAALAAVVVRLLTGPHPVDDAFITFRYARNLSQGLGLVYNPGEWVLGTTTPAWAILLALVHRLGGTDLPLAASVLSALLDGVSAGLVALLALRIGWGQGGAALAGMAWALNPMSTAFAVGGMESSLFALLALTCLVLAASGRTTAAALLGGLGVAVRPEALLLAATAIAWRWWTQRKLPVAAVLVASAVVGAYAGLLWLVYGSPLPSSMLAKQAAYQGGSALANLVLLTLQAGLPGWSTLFINSVGPSTALVVATIGLVVLAALIHAAFRRRGAGSFSFRSVGGWGGASFTKEKPSPPPFPSKGGGGENRKCSWPSATTADESGAGAFSEQTLRRGVASRAAWQPFAAFGLTYFTFYVASGARHVPLFPWYLVPLALLYLLLWVAGLRSLVRGAPTTWAAVALLLWQAAAVDWRHPFLPAGAEVTREAVYARVGADLAAELPRGAVVASPEIGALGYSSGLRILDTVGLVSPIALRYYPLPADQLEAGNAVPPRLVADQAPDAVVSLDEFARRSLLPDPVFQRSYRLVRTYPIRIWRSTAVLVFRRADELSQAATRPPARRGDTPPAQVLPAHGCTMFPVWQRAGSPLVEFHPLLAPPTCGRGTRQAVAGST